MNCDVFIFGGGVIGLSIAFESARNGKSVIVADQKIMQPQTSWAGAGIISPANYETAVEPLEQLRAISNQCHWRWSAEFRRLCGIDNELENCGALYFARSPGELAALVGLENHWKEEEIEFEVCDFARIQQLFPALSQASIQQEVRRCVHLPGESRIRNPRHLKALRLSCEALGVRWMQVDSNLAVDVNCDRIESVTIGDQKCTLEHCCFAAGSWTQSLLELIDIKISTTPVRGQMVLFELEQPLVKKTIYDGSLYLVSRNDGHILAGSTIEEVGFDNSTTEQAINNLVTFANRWFPDLNRQTMQQSWAGLRPATYDGFPYVGRVPNLSNGYVATGHFRSGIQLSTGTAIVIHQLMNDDEPEVNLEQFNPARG